MLLALVVGARRPEVRPITFGGIAIFYVVIFLATWAGGLWIMPFGLAVAGVQWLPYLLIGLMVALLIAAVMPDRRETYVRDEGTGERLQAASEIALGAFFWLLLVVLILAILAGYQGS